MLETGVMQQAGGVFSAYCVTMSHVTPTLCKCNIDMEFTGAFLFHKTKSLVSVNAKMKV